jgi:ABC-2 type transport system ATP-binding protein
MIQVSNLTRYYGDFAAVKNVSFSVEAGEIIGLLGLNGAGKSTTLKVLAGLIPPSSGEVRIDGQDVITGNAELRARIGYLPDEPPLYGDMTVRAFLVHAGRLKGMSSTQVAQRLPEVLRITHLEARADQVIETLSHGYQKRVGIAQAIIHDPRLVILDEPISGLDPAQIAEMRQVIRNLGQGRAVLVSSHILAEVSQTCDRIFVIHDGELRYQGTETELVARAGNRLRITVRGEPQAVRLRLQAHPSVSAVTHIEAQGPLTAVELNLANDDREAIVADLVAAGFGVRSIEAPRSELEEMFLRITGTGGAA